MSKYKALMLDLDGTTIPNSPTGMPSSRILKTIQRAQAKLAVCVVTGRFLYEVEPVLDILNISTPTVLMGGSQIIDGKNRKPIYKQPLITNDVSTIIEQLKNFNVDIIIREENKNIEYSGSYHPVKPYAVSVKNISEEIADSIINVISHVPTITAHKILSWTAGYYYLNISHVSATKQYAIYEVAKMLGIKTHEMIGVGDGPNDFPLLMACGLKVAMGNAVSNLKEIADYIAPTVEEDGVADVIEKFVLTN